MYLDSVTFPIAFISGLISFFAPCVIPLLPVYVSYIAGVSLSELKKSPEKYNKKVIVSSLFYILGFTLTFTLLGTTATGLGIFFRRYVFEIQSIAGVLMIFFGLQLAGLLNIKLLSKQIDIKIPEKLDNFKNIRSLFIGFLFAVTWTPCVGPILGIIYTLAASGNNIYFGASLLFVYSLGIAIPFVIVSLAISSAPKYLKIINKKIELINKVAGFILAALGIMLITGHYSYLNQFVFDLATRLGF